jgi:probable HAF family extracellular repeat protein
MRSLPFVDGWCIAIAFLVSKPGHEINFRSPTSFFRPQQTEALKEKSMKPRILTILSAVTLFTALTIPIRLAGQDQSTPQEGKKEQHRYKLIDVGTFGGPNSYFVNLFFPLTNNGLATGTADTAVAVSPSSCFFDCFVGHAFRWQDGVLTDLGSLPGDIGSFPSEINSNGVVAGVSLNHLDPVTLFPVFTAVVWKDGEIIDLGTFGGTFSAAEAINDRDQVVGFALNATPDSFDLGDFCQNNPMPTQMRAFVWQRGVLKDLGTLGGTDSCALFVNDRGQTVGNSFTNSIVNPTTGLPTLHPFLWDDGEMMDLGTLGGTLAFVNGINSRGQVAGASTLAGDQIFHPFLWDQGKLTDLGTLGGNFVEVIGLNDAGEVVGKAQLPGSSTLHAFLAKKNASMIDLGSLDGDPCSVAISINAQAQIVGFSDDCSGNNQHAFLWENGRMTDLNGFVSPASDFTLIQALFINDRGEIAAQGVLPNGDQRAVLLIPCGEGEDGCEAENPNATTRRSPIPSGQSSVMGLFRHRPDDRVFVSRPQTGSSNR